MFSRLLIVLGFFSFFSCSEPTSNPSSGSEEVYIKVLGIAQDAGYPQVGCRQECCRKYWQGNEEKRMVVSLGLVDKKQNKVWMFEATPDFKQQYQSLISELEVPDENSFAGIFLTHAHMGHYTGLMQVGFEAMNTHKLPVYTMPEMQEYLDSNGPWSQLITKENITLVDLNDAQHIQLGNNIEVTPMLVPHRDEYSETVGFRIGKNKEVLFIPDINKWSIWEKSIVDQVKKVDRAYLDATFFNEDELPGRDMSQIPHPFVVETMALFENQPDDVRSKVEFIHFNHTNKLLFNGEESKHVRQKGYNISRNGSIFSLN